MSSVLMQFTPLPQNAARLEKPHALAAKLRAILGDKVIKDWKWLQTTIMHADRASGASTTLGIYFEIFILGDFASRMSRPTCGVPMSACRRHLTLGST
jgi:hypothetical protein